MNCISFAIYLFRFLLLALLSFQPSANRTLGICAVSNGTILPYDVMPVFFISSSNFPYHCHRLISSPMLKTICLTCADICTASFILYSVACYISRKSEYCLGFPLQRRSCLLSVVYIGFGFTLQIKTNQGYATLSGICCITSPSRSFPLACLFRLIPSLPQVPHCLKKKAEPCCSTCRLMLTTQSSIIGLAFGPLSPPTIIQSMPLRLILPKSSINGSQERNLTEAFR